MNEKSKEEMEELKKLNEAYLKDIGYEYMNAVCEEADVVMKKYVDLEVPKSLNKWFYGYMEEQKKEAKRLKRKKTMIKMSKRVAAVFLISGIVLSAVTLSVDAFRFKLFNLILETKERFGLMFYEEEKQELLLHIPEDWTGYYTAFLPEGYTLLDYEIGISVSRLTYIDGNGNTIELLQGPIISNSQIDTEDAVVMEVEINGNQGILAEKNEEIIIGWSEKNSSLLLRGNVEKSTLLKIAENIIEKK